MRVRGIAVALALALVGCDAEEVEKLDRVQAELDTQYAQKKAVANERLDVRQKLDALRKSDPLSANPIRDAKALAAQLGQHPLAGQLQVAPEADGLRASGQGGGSGAATAVRALAELAPAFVLRELRVRGDTWQLLVAPPPARAEATPPLAKPLPALPPQPAWETSRAQLRRAQISVTVSHLAELDAAVVEVRELQRQTEAVRQDLEHRGDLERLAQADDAVVALFGGAQPALTAGSIRFTGNGLWVSDPEGKPDSMQDRLGPTFAPIPGERFAFKATPTSH